MISHDSYHHQGRRVSDRPVVFWLKFWIRRASDERLPSCRRRKRLRPGVGWWGSPVRFIVDLGCGYPFLVWFVFLWLLFSGVWETLIFGTGDWFVLGNLSFVACLPQLTHCLGTGSCPNHKKQKNKTLLAGEQKATEYIYIYIYVSK